MRALLTALLLSGIGLLLALRPAHAASPKDNCTGFISSVPAVISTPGTWCLSQNVATSIASGDAITVSSDDVVIDCNDFGLDGSNAGPATVAAGIHAIGRNRTIVRHCTLRGFYRGIQIEGDGSRDVIEENHFDQNTHAGISILANDSAIRHNLVTRTGGSTATPASTTFGILASYNTAGGLNDVLDNTVAGVQATAGSNKTAFAILSQSVLDGVVLRGNRVGGVVPANGAYFAIETGDYARGAIRNNEIQNTATVSNSAGIECADLSGGSAPGVRVRNSVIGGFQFSDLSSCGDAGRNDFNP